MIPPGEFRHYYQRCRRALTFCSGAPLLFRRSCVSAAHHVCVVDDDQSVRLALASLLRSLGYEVETFESGHDVLRWLAHNRTACVVSDLQMPGMSGLQMFEGMLDMGIDAPFVLVTAYPTAEVEARAMAIGVRAFLTKPVSAQALAMHVRQAVAPAG
jgi:FixJ family two-component response regulator